MSAAVRLATAAFAASIASGCYAYHNVSPRLVRPDDVVHMTLSSSASAALASTIGPNATALDGRVLSVDSGRVRLALTQIARVVGPEEFLKDEPVDIPMSGALEMRVRSMDRFRTLLAVGGLMSSVILAHTLSDSPGVGVSKGVPSPGSK
jgi:hypothetical protein